MGFIRGLVLITGLVVMVASGFIAFTGNEFIHPLIWWMVGFFVFVTGFAHYVAHMGLKHDQEHLHAYYYASMGVRMVFVIIAIFIYRYFNEERVIQFVFNFFVLYFIYTGFEIYSLLSNLRQNSKKQI